MGATKESVVDDIASILVSKLNEATRIKLLLASRRGVCRIYLLEHVFSAVLLHEIYDG